MCMNHMYPPVGAALTNSEIKERIADHKAKMNESQVQITQYERCLNARVPIARLPPELLAEIFKFYMETNSIEKPIGWVPPKRRLAHWYAYRFRIAQVSHHWRQVAIQNPCLWADIVTTSLECFKQMLIRSKEAPLAIVWHVMHDSRESREIMRLIVSELHRIRKLVLTAPKSFLRAFNRDCNQPRNATQLRVLHVVDCEKPSGTYVGSIPFISTLSLPQLQELKVTGYSLVSFRMLLLPSLTSLIWSPSTLHTIGHLLDLLQSTPLLCTLLIYDAKFRLKSETSNIHAKLLYLQRLRVGCHLGACATLLNHLEFPKDIEINLFVDGPALSPEDEITDLQAINTALYKTFTPKFLRSFDISPLGKDLGDRCFGIVLTGWSTILPHESPGLNNRDPEPHLQLTFTGIKPIEMLVDMACSQLPLSNVDYLRVNESQDYKIHAWRDTFYRMANLTKLQVSGYAADVLPQALHIIDVPVANTDGVSSKKMKVLFPRLAFLQLKRVCFVERHGLPPAEGDFISRLEGALKDRCAHGYVLAHLDIWPPLSTIYEHMLKEVVKKMT
ncbi:hypothetical protein NEOLEDRAFT_651978 [Neolentinus lepideus HHB14362 ss-1]|uniref:F-box domain-containing protein n=1 Tax=Neolentinus lepideus HHB14362 ss-1 TaxID=1314782 RepID=A0A165QJJ1_9AGAM|nr:hypothetical protein NEOLEDRAFT_651978 [Neolentinus lepideus HHB14362 ss-1]